MNEANEIMNWNAFAAVSTFLAVLVALGISVWQHINQKMVRLRITLATKGRYSEDKKTYIVISNMGIVPETIVRILTKDKKGKITELHNQDFDLPKTLRPHEIIHLDCPYFTENLDKVEEICAEDCSGKKWKCEADSVNHSSKILQNFIGKRLIYPPMGDETDESKIK